MQAELTPMDGQKAIGITFTDKPVTAFGGLALFVAFAQRLGLAERLQVALPFTVTSPNATPPHQILLAFFAGVLAGARRFAQLAVLRADEPVRQLFGLRRFPSTATFTRFFRRFTAKTVTETFAPLFAGCLARLPHRREGYTLDLDSSVFERYGTQEGALKGYNPKKRGRPSHHPLFAVLAEARCIAHVWLRSGNTGAARGASAFLTEVRALLPCHLNLALVRADSGFFDEAFLLTLEAAQLPYIVAARFTNPLQAAAYRLVFRPFAPGLEAAELAYQALRWTAARRVIVVREELVQRPTARGRELFYAPGYRFHAVVTTIGLPPEAIWRTYNGRADTENRLKELKHAFGADGFCSRRFWATEAALRAICLLYNLVEAFQEALAAPVRRTLSTLRVTVFACGALLGRDGRQAVLRLSRTPPWQQQFLAQLRRLLTWVPNCNAVGLAEVNS
jgi:Transposase DDE domain group 1